MRCGTWALVLLFASLTTYTRAEPILIRSVTPVDAVTGTGAVQDVLIDEGVIQAIGQRLRSPDDARIVDGQGAFLIPGLWDMHVHFSYDMRFNDSMHRLFLDYGITSVRDTGGTLDTLLPIIRQLREGGTDAPRVYYAGPLLDGSPVVYNGDRVPRLGVENTEASAARTTVATLAEAGASFIKIYEMVSPEVFRALVDAAAEHDMPIAAHVPLSMLASEAGPLVNSMEHLRNIELDCSRDAAKLLDERRRALSEGRNETGLALRSDIHRRQRTLAIESEDPERCENVLALLRKTTQVPTTRLNALTQYPPFKDAGWEGALAKLPEAVRNDWQHAEQRIDPNRFRRLGDWTLEMIKRLVEAQVPIGAGTDTPIGWAIPGFSLHRELEILVAAGLSNQQALHAATIVPANFLGLDDRMGQISPGQVADLVLLDANPLKNIGNTRRIRLVIADGRVVRDYSSLPASVAASD